MMNDLVGKSYTFEDGNSITITQIKLRDDNMPWVTYQIVQGPGLPRKLVMSLEEFIGNFGHLFEFKTDDNL